MGEQNPKRMSTINRVILTTMLGVFVVFCLLVVVLIQILLKTSINTAKNTYEEHALNISQSVKNSMNLMANMLQVTQDALGAIDLSANVDEESIKNILRSVMEVNPNVYSSWLGLEKGIHPEGSRYMKRFIREDGVIIEKTTPDDRKILKDPDALPWYGMPLRSGKTFFDNVDLEDYGTGQGPIYTATVSVPIRFGGKIAGVCGVDITYSGMFTLGGMLDKKLSRTIMLLSPDLTILHAADQKLIFKKLGDFLFPNINAIAGTAMAGVKFLDEIDSPFSGKRSLVSLYPIYISTGDIPRSLFLYIDTPLDILYADADRIIVVITAACVICMFLIVSIIFININHLLRPIRRLTSQALQISAATAAFGNTSSDAISCLNKKNEIAILECAVNKMILTQKKHLELVEKHVEERTHQLKLMTEEAEAAKARAEEAAEVKSQFLANMSHEIRTPMNAILGMSELLLSETLNDHQERYVQDIHTSALALLDIINDILDLSKIQSGKLGLVPVHYDFPALVSNVGTMARFLIKNKKIVYKPVIFNELPKCLYGDDVRLRQVLLNVLSNAIKFTDEGYVRLTICVSEASIRFDIEDTGIGIKPKDLPNLFEAFTQVDIEKNYNKKGTGLGLSITKALVEMMGGKITVESLYTRGTIFHIMIPKVLGDPSQIRQSESDDMVIWAPDAKVLVVDDNVVNLNVSKGLLQLCKITADTATSGPQAIAMIDRTQYDLVFMDHMMPEMDGIEATRIIRRKGSIVPIVALSANAVAGAKEKFLAAGMNDFLIKPINRLALKKILLDWIPAEKIREPGKEAARDDKTPVTSEFWQQIEQIEELSVNAGLDRVMGQRDIYEGSLKLMIKEIEKCDKNLNDFLAAEDMHNFCIEAHSMKGSLANTGAMELSAKARELEAASDKGDAAFCSLNLPPFLEGLRRLGAGLQEAFALKKQASGPVQIPPEVVRIFNKLTDAFNKTDFVLVNEAVESLDSLEIAEPLKEEIEAVKDAVLIMDYDGAAEVIQKLLDASEKSFTKHPANPAV